MTSIAAELKPTVGPASQRIANIRLTTRCAQVVLLAVWNVGVHARGSFSRAQFFQHVGHLLQIIRIEISGRQFAGTGGRQDFECHDETLVGQRLPTPITCVVHPVSRFPKQVALENLNSSAEHAPVAILAVPWEPHRTDAPAECRVREVSHHQILLEILWNLQSSQPRL